MPNKFRFSVSVFGPEMQLKQSFRRENTGTSEASIRINRINTVGDYGAAFSGIYLPAGEKITRAFRIDENKPIQNQLQLVAKPLGPGGVSVKLTAEQYRSGV